MYYCFILISCLHINKTFIYLHVNHLFDLFSLAPFSDKASTWKVFLPSFQYRNALSDITSKHFRDWFQYYPALGSQDKGQLESRGQDQSSVT